MLTQFRPLITADLLASAPATFATAPHLAEKFDAIDADKIGALTRDELAAWRRARARPSAGAPAEPVKPQFAVRGRRRSAEVHEAPAHDASPGARR
jgi:hypothetical protein